MFCNIKIIIFLLTVAVLSAHAWDHEELEIFDVVEEINKNFYEFMGLSQAANLQEIKRSFRNLSIILHPDKNSAEDANIQFRNLVSIYEILKDKSKREKYDKVLKDGLPNWKSALYYYRRVRKMGLAEGSIIIFVIITIGQYFFSWAAYVEKKYTAEQVFGSKIKKFQKKNKTNVDLDSILNEIPYPSVYDTLPFQIPKGIWNLPKTVKNIYQATKEYNEQILAQKKLEEEEIRQQQIMEEEAIKERQAKKEMKENIRKRRQAKQAPEKTEEELVGYSQLKQRNLNDGDSIKPAQSSKTQVVGGFWSDEDLTELIHLVKKYPGGSSNRWDIIGETMNRSVTEVTFMAAKLKENGYRIPGQKDNNTTGELQVEDVKKVKTKKDTNVIVMPETSWTQVQQQALETAITKYRKTSNADRWQKIAYCVPDKTKEECLMRYKYLVELVKSQKQNQADNEIDAMNENKEEEPIDDELNLLDKDDCDEETERIEVIEPKTGGKPKNRRKEKKKQIDYYDDENSSE